MKKIVIIIMFLLVSMLFLSSCGNSSNQPEDKGPSISSIEILEYQESLVCGDIFDETSVKVKVTFSDGTDTIYSGADLSFNYTEFDTYTAGEQTIKVRIKELNVSESFKVQVNRKSIKILMIANSFGDDTVQWVHEIGDDLGIDFTIANLYIGGCVLSTHLSNLKSDSAAYEYVSYNKETKTWSRAKTTKISTAMTYEDWDYISLQQGSYDSGRAESYGGINEIMDRVLQLKGDVEFLWNMTWAYQQDSGHANFNLYNHDQMTMYNAILNAVQTKVVPNERFKYIIPNGTAVQNARTSVVGDTLCRDVYCHLTYDFGRYIAGLTIVGTVADVDLRDVNYSPNLDLLYKNIAIESAVNALANPFAITPSSY